MVDIPSTLVWECPLCGLETPHPENHLTVHGLTIEKAMELIDEAERHKSQMVRLLMMQNEFSGICFACGQRIDDGG